MKKKKLDVRFLEIFRLIGNGLNKNISPINNTSTSVIDAKQPSEIVFTSNYHESFQDGQK